MGKLAVKIIEKLAVGDELAVGDSAEQFDMVGRRMEIVEAKVAELNGLGASVQQRFRDDDPADPDYYVVMHDPEGNEFCVG